MRYDHVALRGAIEAVLGWKTASASMSGHKKKTLEEGAGDETDRDGHRSKDEEKMLGTDWRGFVHRRNTLDA